MNQAMKISPTTYYSEWSGHPLPELDAVHKHLRSLGKTIVWLAGDSSLDNKHWLFESPDNKFHHPLTDPCTVEACNGYEGVLDPPTMVQDVCYHFNRTAADDSASNYACINTSVEASTLAERKNTLLPQDQFIATHMQEGDILIVSIGGNDIALSPSKRTILAMAGLTFFTPKWMLTKCNIGFGTGHLGRLFRDGIQAYIQNLCANARTAQVMVCMIYYPCEDTSTPSWADPILRILGYNRNPAKLKAIIDLAYERFTCKIKLDGIEVFPIALAHILDSTDPADYDNRVEPALAGGRKMGQAFYELVQKKTEL